MGSNTTPSTHSPGPDDRPKHNPCQPTGATAPNNSSVQLLSPFRNNRCGSASRSDYPDSGHWGHIMSRTTSMAGTYKTVPRREDLQNISASCYHHLPSTITKFSCIPQSLKRRNHSEYSRYSRAQRLLTRYVLRLRHKEHPRPSLKTSIVQHGFCIEGT